MSSKETKARRRAVPGEGNPQPGTEAAEMQKRASGAARAFIIGPVGIEKGTATSGRPRTFPSEGFGSMSRNEVISPPFEPLVLAMLPEQSAHLGKCIDVMVVNIEGFGHAFQRLVNTDDPECPDRLKIAVKAERTRLTNFFANCSAEDTFVELRSKTRRDRESIGFGGWEVIRGPVSGEIQFLNYVPGYRIRLAHMGRELVETEQAMAMLTDNGSREIRNVKVKRYFRRYVVVPPVGTNDKPVWFKQFGDPRDLDAETGKFAPDGEKLEPEKRANELIYFCNHSPRTPYGLPRWLGNLITIMGDRSAEEVNFTTLRNNNIPSMAITVSNGRLTSGSVKRIREFVQTQIQGSANWSRFLILEGEPSQLQDGTDTGQIKLEIKPLTNEQMRDMMFQEYGAANRDKIREAFRLPPIFIGGCHSEDTEYLTEVGWKRFEDVADGVAVATMNTASGALEYQVPTERHSYSFEGELLHLQNRGIDAMVTPNHRFWTRPTAAMSRTPKPWEFLAADTLATECLRGNGGCMEIPVSASWRGRKIERFAIPPGGRINGRDGASPPSKNPHRDTERAERAVVKYANRDVSMDAFLQFLGYFISEGSTTERRGPIMLSQNEGEVLERMVDVLKRLGFDPSRTEGRPGQYSLTICHSGLWEWLRENCGVGCSNKRLPRWVLDLEQEQIESLLNAMIEGDGNRPPLGTEDAFVYSTTSRVLSDQLHEIALRLGYALTTREEDRGENRSIRWISYGHRDSRHLLQARKQIRTVPYSGKVTCFTVPNGTLVTRRNGRVLISGNSDDYTRATADASRKLADEQIFAPERLAFDNWINKFLFPAMGIVYHKFVSQGPNVTDDQDLIRVLMAAERTGGMSPWLAREIIGDIVGRELPPVTGIDVNVPFTLQVAEAAKNQDMNPGDGMMKRLEVGPLQAILAVRDALEEEFERRLFVEMEEGRDNGSGRKKKEPVGGRLAD